MSENIGNELREIVSGWIKQQNTTAKELGISPAGLNKMLTGATPLPVTRFLQLVYYLRPPQNEVDRAFGLYLQELNLPEDGLRLTRKSGMAETAALIDCGWVQKRYAELQAKGAENLSEINKKEIEVIQYWNSGMSEAVPAEPADAKQQVLEYVGKLNADESARALMALKGFFGEK